LVKNSVTYFMHGPYLSLLLSPSLNGDSLDPAGPANNRPIGKTIEQIQWPIH